MSHTLTLFLFGTPQINYRGKPLVGFASNKTRALLIYLAVTAKPHSRDALSDLFWAENRATARTNLRKALSNLRQLEGIKLLEPSSETIALDLRDYWVDVVSFNEIGRINQPITDQLLHATQLYQADFLSDFPISLSYEFEEWALAERSRLKQLMIRLLERLVEKYEEANELSQAIDYAQQILTLEPWREKTYRHLMLLFAHSGDRGAALAQYAQCVRALKDELDIEPSIQTNELYISIRAGKYIDAVTTTNIPQANKTPPTPKPITNLPIPPTPLVGRQQMLADIRAMLEQEDVRLLTLTGLGGVGKTRLAIEIGRDLVDGFVDGVVFCGLASIRSLALVPVAIADALGIRDSIGDRQWADHISDYLQNKEILLIVDNFEHVVEAAPMISVLLSKSPRLHVLVTSREVLHIQGEFPFDVSPLTLPLDSLSLEQDKLEKVESVQLFLQRALAMQPHFVIDDRAARSIAEICVRLDGLPLAIELAAARIKVLDVASIAQRLDARFNLLNGGQRDLPTRHQTLQNAIDWSYELLSDDEQALLRLLSVFAGGCTLEAIESIRSNFDIPTDTLTLMTSLVDKSLVQQRSSNGVDSRFVLLETIREYGLYKLKESGEDYEVKGAHAHFFISLGKLAQQGFCGPGHKIWLDRLELDYDNLHTALGWIIENEWTEEALRLGGSLWYFWLQRGYENIESIHIDNILRMKDVSKYVLLHAQLLLGLGKIRENQGQYRNSKDILHMSLNLFKQVDNMTGMAYALDALGLSYRSRKEDYAQAKRYHERSLSYFHTTQDRYGIASVLLHLGVLTSFTEDVAESSSYFKQTLRIAKNINAPNLIATSVGKLGSLALYRGEYQLARRYLEESIENHRALNTKGDIVYFLGELGVVHCHLGNLINAHDCLIEGFSICKQTNFKWGITFIFSCFALFAAREGNIKLAVCIASAVQSFRGELRVRILNIEQKIFDHVYEEAHQHLSPQELEIAETRGETLTIDEMIDSLETTYCTFRHQPTD